MKQWKRLIYYLLINVLVSACTTVAVLYFWDRTHPPVAGGIQPVAFNAAGADSLPISATQPLTTTLQITGEASSPGPTSTATQDPYAGAIAYEVKANDTMGDIARKFDVPLDELLKYNALTDANALSVGQVIYVPQTPVAPSETPTPERTPTPQATGSPGSPTQAPRIKINSVIGPGDLSAEHVFLTNQGDGVLSLAGWRLEDKNGNRFEFPQIELYKGGGVNVWTTTGSNSVVDLYWGMQSPVWDSGETVTLKDAQGKVQDSYKVP
jgi:LysM repeat protein